MWRWSYINVMLSTRKTVFSTYVEVILKPKAPIASSFSILHVCGGDPVNWTFGITVFMYSPRMWRWSQARTSCNMHQTVFSTYVEVILLHPKSFLSSNCILHVCGGDPFRTDPVTYQLRYSPRMWRWSHKCPLEMRSRNVFSTHVESVTVLERTDK